jgi:pilus assembly protein CpaF
MVNGSQKIFVESKGILKKTSAAFSSEAELLSLMTSVCAAVGKVLDAENPLVDARLPDGSRVHCAIAPIAVDGPALTIRKFSPLAIGAEDLIRSQTMTESLGFFLASAVAAKINVVVSGGTGSGKTTLLNVLGSFVPANERLVVIEDVAELKFKNENLVRLEAKPPTASDDGIPIRKLVLNALRMRPDRIVVGECRGVEAFDMLTAMNTGHEGSMTSVHANSSRDALRRLEAMVLMAGLEMPVQVIRSHISSAVHLVVQVQRLANGKRVVSEVTEIGGMEGNVILSQDLFRWTPDQGLVPTGLVPGFMKLFKERGVDFPQDFFTNRYVASTRR